MNIIYNILDILELHNSIWIQWQYFVYRVEIEEAFAVNLTSGHIVHAGPPPGSGIILAFILRILDGMLPAPDPGLDAHRFVEALKFGYGERSHLGDHKFVDVSKVCFI